jgi:hypothetical protein
MRKPRFYRQDFQDFLLFLLSQFRHQGAYLFPDGFGLLGKEYRAHRLSVLKDDLEDIALNGVFSEKIRRNIAGIAIVVGHNGKLALDAVDL